MLVIEKFLGQSVNIPEDRHYYPKQGLWAKPEGKEIVLGLTEPFRVLVGGFNEVDWLFKEGQRVEKGDTVVFAITGKILYIDTPVAGSISYNSEIKQHCEDVVQDPYGKGWLFKITSSDVNQALSASIDAHQYLESLKGSEGLKNPDGLAGGVSSICKAVYAGIREQNIS
jgi:glycine cleavage system H protein